MSISFVTGRPGSGKTYFLITKILDNLNLDRRVYSNILLPDYVDDNYIYLSEEKFLQYKGYVFSLFNDDIKNLEVQKTKYKESEYNGACFVLDEIQFLGFKKKNESILNWLTMHRHFSQDVFLATQLPKVVHTDYRDMADDYYSLVSAKHRANPKNIEYRFFEGFGGEQAGGRKSIKPRSSVFEIYNTGQSVSGTSYGFKQIKKFTFLFIITVVAVILLGIYGKDQVLGMTKKKRDNIVSHAKHNPSVLIDSNFSTLNCSNFEIKSKSNHYAVKDKAALFLYSYPVGSSYMNVFKVCK